MPNPKHPAALATGDASIKHLTKPPVVTPEFGAVNPVHLWQRPTRWVFAASSDTEHEDSQGHPHLLKLDTESGAQKTWAPAGYRGVGLGFGAPTFIPAAREQAADSDAGTVLALAAEADGTPLLYIIDAATMKEVAHLDLPIAPLPSVGLHNHFSSFPESV